MRGVVAAIHALHHDGGAGGDWWRGYDRLDPKYIPTKKVACCRTEQRRRTVVGETVPRGQPEDVTRARWPEIQWSDAEEAPAGSEPAVRAALAFLSLSLMSKPQRLSGLSRPCWDRVCQGVSVRGSHWPTPANRMVAPSATDTTMRGGVTDANLPPASAATFYRVVVLTAAPREVPVPLQAYQVTPCDGTLCPWLFCAPVLQWLFCAPVLQWCTASMVWLLLPGVETHHGLVDDHRRDEAAGRHATAKAAANRDAETRRTVRRFFNKRCAGRWRTGCCWCSRPATASHVEAPLCPSILCHRPTPTCRSQCADRAGL